MLNVRRKQEPFLFNEYNKYKKKNPKKSVSEIYDEIMKSFKDISGFKDVNERDIEGFASAITGYYLDST